MNLKFAALATSGLLLAATSALAANSPGASGASPGHEMQQGHEVIPNQGAGAAAMRIEAVRRIFPCCWFNEATTEAGRDALGYYHERKDEQHDVGLGPEHDWSSHCADAFGLMAIAYEEPSRITAWSRPLEFLPPESLV